MVRRTPSSQLEIAPGIWLDARRAVWLAQERVLVVADLHLGYPWVQRAAGQLLPVSVPDDSLTRIMALQKSYRPDCIVLLGDIVHRACLDVPQVGAGLRKFLTTLGALCEVRLAAGNHDRGLQKLLESLNLRCQVETWIEAGPHLLLHGDSEPDGDRSKPSGGGFMLMGHEHPAIRLGDGVASSTRCPCFLVGSRLLILPAFSNWAQGTVTSDCGLMSPLARNERFTHAVAILGDRLLSVPLSSGPAAPLEARRGRTHRDRPPV